MKKTILLQIVLILSTISAQAKDYWNDSRFSWRAGLSVSLSTYLQNDVGGEGPTYDVGLAERYGRYHVKVYSFSLFLPISITICSSSLIFLPDSAGFQCGVMCMILMMPPKGILFLQTTLYLCHL